VRRERRRGKIKNQPFCIISSLTISFLFFNLL